MAESPDARTFGLVASPNAPGTAAFRSLVRQATSAETLTDFLRAYRTRYPESAAPERPKPNPDGTPGPPRRPRPAAPAGRRRADDPRLSPRSRTRSFDGDSRRPAPRNLP